MKKTNSVYSDSGAFTVIEFHLNDDEIKFINICNECGSQHVDEDTHDNFVDVPKNTSGGDDYIATENHKETVISCQDCGNADVF